MVKVEVKEKQYAVVQAECPLCGKLLSGTSEKNWVFGFKMHLHLADKHKLPLEEIERIVKTVKPSFRKETKTKSKAKYNFK